MASDTVMMIWAVTANVYGMSPMTFTVRMNMNSENTSGKNFMPSGPAVLCSVLATNS